MTPTPLHDPDPVAVRLALAVNRLRARLREESGITTSGLSMTQISIVGRLRRNGPRTAASLAAAEHVSQQAIAQAVAPLKAAGLVAATPDAADGRKVLLSLTGDGRASRDAMVASRDAWLTRTIERTLSSDEAAALDAAVELLERLADA